MVQLDLFEIVCDKREVTHNDPNTVEWMRLDRDSIHAFWTDVEWELTHGRLL